jgi:hypothetical protein
MGKDLKGSIHADIWSIIPVNRLRGIKIFYISRMVLFASQEWIIR